MSVSRPPGAAGPGSTAVQFAPAASLRLSDALAAVGFPTSVGPDSPDLLMFLDMLPRCQAIRRTGCSALNLCYVAAGRFDLYWSYCTKIWDVAAGALLVREAGGCISSPTGGPFELETAQFLAAGTPALHARALPAGNEDNPLGGSHRIEVKEPTTMPYSYHRRRFLKTAAAAAAGYWLTAGLQAKESKSPNERIAIASIGVYNKGRQ